MTLKPQNNLTAAPLPDLPADLATEQAIQWELVAPALVAPLRAFLDTIMEVRAAHAARVGWLPAQVGYLTIRVPARVRANCRAFIHVVLSDRDLETEAPVEGLNSRVFCYVEATTGEVFKISQGKVLSGARASIHNETSVRRAITPFGIDSR